jgi:hypothetical protein
MTRVPSEWIVTKRGRGRPRLDPKYARVMLRSCRVHPKTVHLLKAIAKQRGVSAGVALDIAVAWCHSTIQGSTTV